jgi:hypothetical protein
MTRSCSFVSMDTYLVPHCLIRSEKNESSSGRAKPFLVRLSNNGRLSVVIPLRSAAKHWHEILVIVDEFRRPLRKISAFDLPPDYLPR